MTDNVAATLCYVLGFITGIIFLVLSPYNQSRNVRFHAFQSIFLSAALMVVHFAITIFVISILRMYLIGTMVSSLVSLGSLVLWVFLLVQTYNNKKIVLPVIGEMAEKQS